VETFAFIIIPILIIIAVITIVDVIRNRSGWSIAGWVLLIVVLPVIGSAIYWFTRKGTPEEAEHVFLAEQDRRYESAHKPIDRGF
jgi:hypothetical protein